MPMIEYATRTTILLKIQKIKLMLTFSIDILASLL